MYILVVFGGSANLNEMLLLLLFLLPLLPLLLLLLVLLLLFISSASSTFIAPAVSASIFASFKISSAFSNFFCLSFACFAFVAFAPYVFINVSNFFVSLPVLSRIFVASFAFADFARKYCAYEPGYETNFLFFTSTILVHTSRNTSSSCETKRIVPLYFFIQFCNHFFAFESK